MKISSVLKSVGQNAPFPSVLLTDDNYKSQKLLAMRGDKNYVQKASSGSSKWTKSCKGCLTCRSRKIRCDLARPCCIQCKKQNLHCDGYGVKLRWHPRERGTRTGVDFVKYPAHMVYEYQEEIDTDLITLDNNDPIGATTETAGPFGVFVAKTSIPNLVYPPYQSDGANTNDSLPTKDKSAISSFQTSNKASYPALSDVKLVQELIFADSICDINATENSVVNIHDSDDLVFESVSSNDILLSCIGNPEFLRDRFLQLGPMAQILAHHYHKAVIPLVTKVWSSGGVWTVSGYKLSAAIGGVISSGMTTFTKLCLIYGALAISASHIRRSCPSRNDIQYQVFGRLAQILRDKCKSWICKSLENHHVGKYKDFLLALQSALLAEYTSEDKCDVEVMKTLLKRTINLQLQSGIIASPSVATLHRNTALVVAWDFVSGYWDQSSSCTSDDPLDDDSWIDVVFSDIVPLRSYSLNHLIDYLQGQESRRTELGHIQYSMQLYVYLDEYLSSNVEENPLDTSPSKTSEFEENYGIPASLTYLLKEVVMTSVKVQRERLTRPSEPVSFDSALAEKCTIIEATLVNWKQNYEPPTFEAPVSEDSPEGQKGKMSAMIYHHSLAHFEALTIYYFRVVKGVPPSSIQHAVKK